MRSALETMIAFQTVVKKTFTSTTTKPYEIWNVGLLWLLETEFTDKNIRGVVTMRLNLWFGAVALYLLCFAKEDNEVTLFEIGFVHFKGFEIFDKKVKRLPLVSLTILRKNTN